MEPGCCGWTEVDLICDRDGEGFVATQTAPDLFHHHPIDLKGRPGRGVSARCPHAVLLPHIADGIG